jgi:ribokinase
MADRHAPQGRLVLFTAVLTDLMVSVEKLPVPGGDVPGEHFREVVGGGFNIVAAAGRLGMATAYARFLGGDARGQRARRALLAEGVELLLPQPRQGMSGVCFVMVDASGERTMVTVEGVEAKLEASDLAQIRLGTEDIVYVSGYDLTSAQGSTLGRWLETRESSGLIFDPGPLMGDLAQSVLDVVVGAATWLSMNAAEAEALTGENDARKAATTALSYGERLRGVVIRTGSEGCLLAVPDEGVSVLPAFPAEVVDTTGAGDAHVGAFLAALAKGLSPRCACVWANAAASVVVGQLGRATAPGLGELNAILTGLPAGLTPDARGSRSFP